MKILYFDCFSGISGDMTIGALLDAGGDFENLKEQLKKLQIEEEYELSLKKVNKNGITATKFDVILKNDHHSHHHHEHGHGHEHHHHRHVEHEHHHHENEGHIHDHQHHEHSNQTHTHSHGHDHHHHSDHTHTHFHDHSHHHHRAYKDIVKLIKNANFSEAVESMALQIFKRIGEAEGKIHGMPLEQVHFHEVGAVDSIIDIVGTAILIHQLEIESIISAPIPVGSGRIHIDHGIYPVPAPATLEILKGVPLAKSDIKGELTTPTGAAIVATLANEYGTLPAMTVTSIGYGAGTKTFDKHPNVLRVTIGE